ncbi:hypothetical protein TWF696_008275 [Orbilia brochopaga]|uniref:Non-specific serine/threonine protein kinase n=1 Tax=Orbilia brochopaga TaxID=3140254 RepID=A0AAV9UFH3_9PEZI
MKLGDYIDMVAPPDIRPPAFTLPDNTLSRLPSNPGSRPKDMVPWDGFDDEIVNFLEPYIDKEYPELEDKFGFKAATLGRLAPVSESQVMDLARRVYEDPVCRILLYLFGIQAAFYDHRATINIGNPDRILVRLDPPQSPSSASAHTPTNEGGQKARLVVEFKTPWTLELPDDLAEVYNKCKKNPDHKITRTIQQIYGYMCWNDVRVGVLSTYTSTFFFQRDQKLQDGLRVSRKVKHSDTGLRSVVAGLAYVCHFAMMEEQALCGTHILSFDGPLSVIYAGTWNSRLKIPWNEMRIVVGERLSCGNAAVVTAQLRHREYDKKMNDRFKKLVVCKIYDLSSPESAMDAQTELDMYIRLKRLQGKYIPTLYAAGTYWGMLRILVLEKCGGPVPLPPPPSFWPQARQTIESLHSNGVVHGDVRMHNFTVNRTNPSDVAVRLIDFARSSPPDKHEFESLCRGDIDKFDDLRRRVEEGSNKGSGYDYGNGNDDENDGAYYGWD